jgi:two-component system NtrC family response regulator
MTRLAKKVPMPLDEVKTSFLIVEDDEAALRQLRWTFDDYKVETATNRSEAMERVREDDFPIVLLDLGLPPDAEGASEGLATLREILDVSPLTKVIVVTGREEREHALQAVELGAHEFYRKPVQVEEIRFIVERARRLYELELESRSSVRAGTPEPLPGIVSASDSMKEVCRLVQRAASSDISVLLLGESGTGKELLARALHELSSRSSGPFIAINCAAIPDQLLESELFGHERGAFTGADRRLIGRLETAHEGTLLLDEIGDMPTPLQAKVLRFLQERVIQRVGGRTDIQLDTRIVSATHQNLQSLAAEGAFREDLYYRLSELSISIPPLRERPEDTVLLAQHFFEKFRADVSGRVMNLAPDAVAAIVRHDWPGNVRELENRVKRGVLLAEGKSVTVEGLDLAGEMDTAGGASTTLKEAVVEAERSAVTRAWAESGGNVSRASKLLGVSRPTLYKLLKDHGIRD